MRTVKQTIKPVPKAISTPALERVRRSIDHTEHSFLLAMDWEPLKRGGWRVGDFHVDTQGSIVVIHRVWRVPVKF